MASPLDTLIVKAWVVVPPMLSETWTVKLNAPACVGVPVTLPPELSESPGGSAPATTDQA